MMEMEGGKEVDEQTFPALPLPLFVEEGRLFGDDAAPSSSQRHGCGNMVAAHGCSEYALLDQEIAQLSSQTRSKNEVLRRAVSVKKEALAALLRSRCKQLQEDEKSAVAALASSIETASQVLLPPQADSDDTGMLGDAHAMAFLPSQATRARAAVQQQQRQHTLALTAYAQSVLQSPLCTTIVRESSSESSRSKLVIPLDGSHARTPAVGMTWKTPDSETQQPQRTYTQPANNKATHTATATTTSTSTATIAPESGVGMEVAAILEDIRRLRESRGRDMKSAFAVRDQHARAVREEQVLDDFTRTVSQWRTSPDICASTSNLQEETRVLEHQNAKLRAQLMSLHDTLAAAQPSFILHEAHTTITKRQQFVLDRQSFLRDRLANDRNLHVLLLNILRFEAAEREWVSALIDKSVHGHRSAIEARLAQMAGHRARLERIAEEQERPCSLSATMFIKNICGMLDGLPECDASTAADINHLQHQQQHRHRHHRQQEKGDLAKDLVTASEQHSACLAHRSRFAKTLHATTAKLAASLKSSNATLASFVFGNVAVDEKGDWGGSRDEDGDSAPGLTSSTRPAEARLVPKALADAHEKLSSLLAQLERQYVQLQTTIASEGRSATSHTSQSSLPNPQRHDNA